MDSGDGEEPRGRVKVCRKLVGGWVLQMERNTV